MGKLTCWIRNSITGKIVERVYTNGFPVLEHPYEFVSEDEYKAWLDSYEPFQDWYTRGLDTERRKNGNK